MLRKQTHILLASVFVLTLLGAGSAFAQSAFAKVNGMGTVATFGGSDTSNASAVPIELGRFRVTFTGAYLATITPDDVVINTTAETFGLFNPVVTSAIVRSATPSQIVIDVSFGSGFIDNAFFISVNVGTGPTAQPLSVQGHQEDTNPSVLSDGS